MEDLPENKWRRKEQLEMDKKERLEVDKKKGKGRVSRGAFLKGAGTSLENLLLAARGEGVIRAPWHNRPVILSNPQVHEEVTG